MSEKNSEKLKNLLWVLFGINIISAIIMILANNLLFSLLAGLTFSISGGLTAATVISMKRMLEAYQKDAIATNKNMKEEERLQSINQSLDNAEKIETSHSDPYEEMWTRILEKLPG